MKQTYPEWTIARIFLTPKGDDPSNEHWLPVALSDVISAISGNADEASGQAADMLQSYVKMMRRHVLDNERLAELTRRIWATNGEALDFLMARKPDVLAMMMDGLRAKRDDLAEQLSAKSNLTIRPDNSSARFLRFAVHSWDD